MTGASSPPMEDLNDYVVIIDDYDVLCKFDLVVELKKLTGRTTSEVLYMLKALPLVIQYESVYAFPQSVAMQKAEALTQQFNCTTRINVASYSAFMYK